METGKEEGKKVKNQGCKDHCVDREGEQVNQVHNCSNPYTIDKSKKFTGEAQKFCTHTARKIKHNSSSEIVGTQ